MSANRSSLSNRSKDVFVAVAPTPERVFRVVEMESPESIESDETLERFKNARVAFVADEVVAGRDEMTGVQAHPKPRGSLEQVDDRA
jgi:hypothetical protein